MSKEASFDVVSDFDHQELLNAVDQVRREIATRFDLKDSNTDLELKETELILTSGDDMKRRNILLILEEKIAKRGLSPQILDSTTNEAEAALGGRVRHVLLLRKGIDTPAAKKVVAAVKALNLKVQASIQGEQVRVTGKNRDDLQQVIQALKQKEGEWNLPLQFNNFR
jgi:cyclic-di-GMP-binding protein